ncbi:MAG: choice-of-anchor tandem repeat GloVer-containing protein [Candidatus Korobacteraceae bacterium]
MRSNRLFRALTAAAVISTVALFTTTTFGAAHQKVLHSFDSGTDGAYTYANLIFDAAGNLYGTTYWGGIHDAGTVFEITP